MSSLYQLYEWQHAILGPARVASDAARLMFRNPFNPVSHTPFGKGSAAVFELFERTTRRYTKPHFRIRDTQIAGRRVAVHEEVVWARPFCRLVHFRRELPSAHRDDDTKLIIVAPLSGHNATLLRGTVEAMLPRHDVYITDWTDARMVPLLAGPFGLDDYVDYLIEMFRLFGGEVHVMAVCQPAVPVLAAVAVMSAAGDPAVPQSMTLMAGPIDTRVNPTEVNRLAETRDIDWFRRHVIMRVPWPHPGFLRRVYPGFLQLSGFMSMNLDRHVDAHKELFLHLVRGDGDSADKHREFYDEYLAVMDLDAAFYLQTVETVFIRHSLPRGEMMHRGLPVSPAAIRRTALLTIEGGKDDISGAGQTEAAHRLCSSLPERRRDHHVQPEVGHYGVFNGSRFRTTIAPRISAFIAAHHRPPGLLRRTIRTLKNRQVPAESDD